MRSWSQPTDEELDRVVALAARPENRAYFFDRIENPNWVSALSERGFFSDQPEPVPASEPGYVRFPPWPEGRYLARMAPLAPESVVSVLQSIQPSESPTVTRHLLEAAGALPDAQLRELAPTINDWLSSPFTERFADEGAAVAGRLLEAGEIARGLATVKALLEVRPDPRLAEKAAAGDSPLRPQLEAVGRLSEWNYERIIEQLVNTVVDSAGRAGLRVFCSLLDDALRHSSWRDGAGQDDYSYIWRPAIEAHEQNAGIGIKDLLVSAVRDLAVALAEKGESELEAVVEELESRSVLYRRVALHVLASSSQGKHLVRERVASQELFEDHRLRHEFASLLRHRFPDADPAGRREFLAWIEAGPNLPTFRQRHTELTGSPPSDEDVERYAQTWRRDWYSFVADYLEGPEAERYNRLVDTLGAPEHPDFLSWSTSGWVGPESPVASEELRERPPEDVIEYLHGWRPDDDSEGHFGPSIEGLGKAFGEVVKERSGDYAEVAEHLTGLDPTYARSFFSGLEAGLRDGGSFSWAAPLRLATHAISQPFEPYVDVPDQDRDPGWRWCRREIASLIRTGLTDQENRIPLEFRSQVWDIIERLTSDPNPSPEHELQYGGDNMDPLTLSINTNRGTAMHAVMEYGLWCRRQLESSGENVSRGFELMPEVPAVLKRHLDPMTEPSLAVRAVYGRWLPWLLLLDEAWTVGHLPDMFPTGPDHDELADTAWATYLAWCPAYDLAFRALRGLYENAVQRVPSGLHAGTLAQGSVDSKLGEHLVTFYWRGVADEAIVDQFFERADDGLTSDVMEYVGRVLRNTEGETPPQVLERIRILWERRLAVVENDTERHKEEARAFGVSFASGKFDEAWALEALEKVLQLAGVPKPGRLVAERLAMIAQARPVEAARLFAHMLTTAENDWDYIAWRDQARSIVTSALEEGSAAAAEHCTAIIDFYVGRGELDFRQLVPRDDL